MIEWHDVLGTAGVFCVIGTYLLLQLGRMDNTKVLFSALNGLGAGLILVSLIEDFNLSAFIVESFWLLISLYGVITTSRARRASQSSMPPVK